MSSFTCAEFQEWLLDFDAFLLDRIEKEAGVDLADMSAAGLLAVTQDVKALARVLVVACEQERKERHVSADDFQKRIRRDVITGAREALLDALADFFPQSEWFEMLSNLEKLKKQPTMSAQDVELMAHFMSMTPEQQTNVVSLITGGSLGSFLDGGSVSDQDTPPPKRAEDSPESAASAQEDLVSATSG